MERLKERIAVVTGSARGIGRGIVERFLAEGAAVLMVDLLADVLAESAQELSAPDRRIETMALDLTEQDAPVRIREAAEQAFGGIDILVNNAGIGVTGRVEDFSDDQWDQVLALNLKAPFRIAREVVPRMAARGYGRVINISSFAATAGMREDVAYAVSKAGVEALTRSIAVDYGASGVTCNCIAPGTIITPLSRAVLEKLDPRMPIIQITVTNKPVPGEGLPADIAAAVAFLSSDDARFVTGHVIPVDGGASTTSYVPEPEGLQVERYIPST